MLPMRTYKYHLPIPYIKCFGVILIINNNYIIFFSCHSRGLTMSAHSRTLRQRSISPWNCSIDELLFTVNNPAWKSLNEWSAHKKISNPLSKFKLKINKYFKLRKIDGQTFKNLNSARFVADLTEYIKSINKKQIQNALKQLYNFIEDNHKRQYTRTHITSLPSTPTHTHTRSRIGVPLKISHVSSAIRCPNQSLSH